MQDNLSILFNVRFLPNSNARERERRCRVCGAGKRLVAFTHLRSSASNGIPLNASIVIIAIDLVVMFSIVIIATPSIVFIDRRLCLFVGELSSQMRWNHITSLFLEYFW